MRLPQAFLVNLAIWSWTVHVVSAGVDSKSPSPDSAKHQKDRIPSSGHRDAGKAIPVRNLSDEDIIPKSPKSSFWRTSVTSRSEGSLQEAGSPRVETGAGGRAGVHGQHKAPGQGHRKSSSFSACFGRACSGPRRRQSKHEHLLHEHLARAGRIVDQKAQEAEEELAQRGRKRYRDFLQRKFANPSVNYLAQYMRGKNEEALPRSQSAGKTFKNWHPTPEQPKVNIRYQDFYPHVNRKPLERSHSVPSGGTPGTAVHTTPLGKAKERRIFAKVLSTDKILEDRRAVSEDISQHGREQSEIKRLLQPARKPMRLPSHNPYWHDRSDIDTKLPHVNYVDSSYP